ncbi:glyoxalase family protein [Halomicrobium zhouii]|uniref:Glyoxalase family protein n=1 Tax=Halomicrobium zhouii TaxID=767519 RepID=A0A1I6LXA4_9EURY|nr:ring-cleaving dioxygenase [Halomicrobium zhouii]SFS08038.1 glyoxalase family protein [Halomicrobium zhouii]
MPTEIAGIHHVTAVGSDPGRNLAFYTETLGLRLVKRSINQDDVSVYHLFYADHDGTPGTSMTFFPYPGARSGRVGTGQVSTTAFTIPADSVEFWTERLAAEGVDVDEPSERFGDIVVPFRDPDGLPLELVATADAPPANLPDGPAPEEHAIRGFYGVTLSLQSAEPTVDLLETMGYEETQAGGDGEAEHDRWRFEASGDLGAVLDVVEQPQAPRGQPGAGTIHHVAFRVENDEQEEWREVLQDEGLRPTQIIDRKWFRSVYVREHGGILFEFATKSPGYTVDEDVNELGEKLVLPEWLEDRRGEIEAGLPDLS